MNSGFNRGSIEGAPLYPCPKLLGLPVNSGQPRTGTECGPELIRTSNLVQCLESIGVVLEDCGDVQLKDISPTEDTRMYGMLRPRNFITNTLEIANQIERLLKLSENASTTQISNHSPIIAIGGDHSCAAGTILGHKRARPNACVIWVDAHADLNTPMTSESGNIHGMPVAFLMHELQDEIPMMEELISIKPCLTSKDIAYIGLRDVDRHEVYDIRSNGIAHFTMVDVDKDGIDSVIRQAIDAVNPRLDRPIHLSFDIDALDPMFAPSTGTPVPGGLKLREAMRICEEVSATGLLSVIELTELNPKLGSPEDVKKTQEAAVQILKTCLGHRRSGHLPWKVHSLSELGVASMAERRKQIGA